MVAVRNLRFNQGEDFQEIFSIKSDGQPIDLTGYQFEGDCRAEQNQTSTILFSFAFTVIENGYFVQVDVPYEDFADVPLGPTVDNIASQFHYDYFLTAPDGTREKLQKGTLVIEPAVTELP